MDIKVRFCYYINNNKLIYTDHHKYGVDMAEYSMITANLSHANFFSGTHCTDSSTVTSSDDELITSGKIITFTIVHGNNTTVLENTNSRFQECTCKEGRLTNNIL